MLSPICVMVQPFLASFSPMNTGKASGKSLYSETYSEKLTLRQDYFSHNTKKSAVLQFDVPRTANAITLETFFATGKQSPEVAHVVLGVYVALYNGLKLWRIIEITPVTVKVGMRGRAFMLFGQDIEWAN